jgi:hypothetical protein
MECRQWGVWVLKWDSEEARLDVGKDLEAGLRAANQLCSRGGALAPCVLCGGLCSGLCSGSAAAKHNATAHCARAPRLEVGIDKQKVEPGQPSSKWKLRRRFKLQATVKCPLTPTTPRRLQHTSKAELGVEPSLSSWCDFHRCAQGVDISTGRVAFIGARESTNSPRVPRHRPAGEQFNIVGPRPAARIELSSLSPWRRNSSACRCW